MAGEQSAPELLSEAWMEDTLSMIRSASRLSLGWFRSDRHQRDAVENKVVGEVQQGGNEAAYDPVTEADRMVERRLRDDIGRRFPDHGIIGEEYGTHTGTSRYSWIIDPIDGTRAFIVGQPMWGTLVGLLDDGRPVAGWMHIPCLDESYIGVVESYTETVGSVALNRVHGSSPQTVNAPSVERVEVDRRLNVSLTTTLSQAILASTHPDMFDDDATAAGYRSLRSSVRMTRFGGDCLNYGLLAAGLVDLVVENGLAPYDIAPLIPIIEAAGGIVTTVDGGPAAAGGFVVAAATASLHEAALRHLTTNR